MGLCFYDSSSKSNSFIKSELYKRAKYSETASIQRVINCLVKIKDETTLQNHRLNW